MNTEQPAGTGPRCIDHEKLTAGTINAEAVTLTPFYYGNETPPGPGQPQPKEGYGWMKWTGEWSIFTNGKWRCIGLPQAPENPILTALKDCADSLENLLRAHGFNPEHHIVTQNARKLIAQAEGKV